MPKVLKKKKKRLSLNGHRPVRKVKVSRHALSGGIPRLETGDLIDLANLRPAEFTALLDTAAAMKAQPGRYRALLDQKGLAMIFEKPSLRTRVTFDVAMQSMGGYAVFLDFTDSPLGEREDIFDVARNLDLWMNAIVARTFQHESIKMLAESAGIPVVNGLSDHSHPCQALADYLVLRELYPGFRVPGERKARIKLAYVGDGNNTLHSLIEAAALSGIRLGIATPAGYEPDANVVKWAQEMAERTGAEIEVSSEIDKAVRGAHAVYTDTWASMGQEAEATQRARDFGGYQVNQNVMAIAEPGARFMHCLPAHRGQEVSVDVIDSSSSAVYRQAENRLHAQKAILASLILGA